MKICQNHGRQRGFTLVELIVVIVILGVLAVSAAPKFIDMKKDAKVATLNHMKGVVRSLNNMVYGKAIIRGNNTSYTEKSVNKETCKVNNGSWSESCANNNCVEVGGTWLYLKYAYLDRNSVAYAIDGDVGGTKTTQKGGKTVPNRCETYECLNKTCASYGDEVCEHDICQCRSSDNVKGITRDTQHLLLRGTKYKGGKCYLGYSSAEIFAEKKGGECVEVSREPAYTIVSDDC
ncbi:MAG: type II secretion system protein [Succinivibrionaceae bacterium]|nr:type II secretion system protein [Succinivibrionaceae bacterium]